MHSLMGVVPAEHPDLRPWIAFEDWPAGVYPLRKNFDASQPLIRACGDYPYQSRRGGCLRNPGRSGARRDHRAGALSLPGGRRGRRNLEERLGYVHKGIEKRFESLPRAGAPSGRQGIR